MVWGVRKKLVLLFPLSNGVKKGRFCLLLHFSFPSSSLPRGSYWMEDQNRCVCVCVCVCVGWRCIVLVTSFASRLVIYLELLFTSVIPGGRLLYWKPRCEALRKVVLTVITPVSLPSSLLPSLHFLPPSLRLCPRSGHLIWAYLWLLLQGSVSLNLIVSFKFLSYKRHVI